MDRWTIPQLTKILNSTSLDKNFATKLWNITNFVMLFRAVMKFLFRLVKIKILEKW
jgi:valyl-tRNA synthetase